MKLIEESYHVPEGYRYRDFPFAYVFQPPSTLVTGKTYQDIQIPLQGDSDFILRHIAGIDTIVDTAANGGRWNYKRHNRQYAMGNPTTGIVPFPNWPVVPEVHFTYNEAIWLDLYDFLQATNACGGTPIPYGSVAFFGVKRFRDNQGYRTQQTSYRYKEMPQRYELQLTISQAGSGAGGNPTPQRISQLMDNFDFELLRISISLQNETGTLLLPDFSFILYDANMHQTSDNPIPQSFVNAGKPTFSTQPPYQGCFPVPSLVYPAGSAIVMDVTSFVCSRVIPTTYNISFEGIWRLPC